MQLTRRTLLAGGALLALPYLARPALARTGMAGRPVVARVITMFDASGSTTNDSWFVPLRLRYVNMMAWADVMEKRLADIISQSEFDLVEFQVNEWNTAVNPFVPLTVLRRNACQDDCNRIAAFLRRAARMKTMGKTDLPQALAHTRHLCSPAVARNIINLVTDDDRDRTRPSGELQSLRAELLARGNITINGLVMGDPAAMDNYMERDVAGGPKSFVLRTTDFKEIRDAWEEKFRLDMVG